MTISILARLRPPLQCYPALGCDGSFRRKFSSAVARRKLVIVTGANRGIGNAMCRLILQDASLKPLKLYATSRRRDNLGLSIGDDQKLLYPMLDISSKASIDAFASEVRAAGQPVDVLVNNAGVNLDKDFSFENANKTLDTNYRGTLEMCKAFLPLMRRGTGRIVNLSSVGSSLKTWKPDLAEKVRKISTFDELEELVQGYLSRVRAGTDVEAGFPFARSYSVSKAGVNILTSILAKENPDLTINCCCPGWIDTSMGGLLSTRKVRPPKTPEEGSQIPLRLAFGDVGGVSGRYWANDSVRSKADGKPQEW